MVARFGAIMPAPLAIPPTTHACSPTGNSTATSLGLVSVVMIARAASAPAWRESAPARLRDAGADLLHRQADADDAGRGHQHLLDRTADRVGHDLGRLAGVSEPALAGPGVRAAGVDDHGARPAAPQVLP